MSVVIETTKGDITVDLYLKERPRACLNFLKLCKIKYYNYNLFHTISRNFIAQTGDPTGSRTGGESIFGLLEGPEKRYVEAETNPRIKHTKMGLISFVCNDDRMMASQFFFTLGDELTYLDEKHCVFGEVVEGLDVLEEINEAICCPEERPYQDIRITHTVILDDPLPDPTKLKVPSRSPSPSAERLQNGRIPADEEIDEAAGKSAEEVNEIIAEREAKARATILEMIGDIPDAEMAPPENVLFVCKLNPVTTDDDLEIIFSRFGKIKSCEVIRDHKTGDSLQYAFIEFENKKACEDAYFKMDNVLIDDRRIHVDFSQSVSKIKWRGKGRGVTYHDDEGNRTDKPPGDYRGKRDVENGENYKRTDAQRTSHKHAHQTRKRAESPGERKHSRRCEGYSGEAPDSGKYLRNKNSQNSAKERPSKRHDRYRESPENSRAYSKDSSSVGREYEKIKKPHLDHSKSEKHYEQDVKYVREKHKKENEFRRQSYENEEEKYRKCEKSYKKSKDENVKKHHRRSSEIDEDEEKYRKHFDERQRKKRYDIERNEKNKRYESENDDDRMFEKKSKHSSRHESCRRKEKEARKQRDSSNEESELEDKYNIKHKTTVYKGREKERRREENYSSENEDRHKRHSDHRKHKYSSEQNVESRYRDGENDERIHKIRHNRSESEDDSKIYQEKHEKRYGGNSKKRGQEILEEEVKLKRKHVHPSSGSESEGDNYSKRKHFENKSKYYHNSSEGTRKIKGEIPQKTIAHSDEYKRAIKDRKRRQRSSSSSNKSIAKAHKKGKYDSSSESEDEKERQKKHKHHEHGRTVRQRENKAYSSENESAYYKRKDKLRKRKDSSDVSVDDEEIHKSRRQKHHGRDDSSDEKSKKKNTKYNEDREEYYSDKKSKKYIKHSKRDPSSSDREWDYKLNKQKKRKLNNESDSEQECKKQSKMKYNDSDSETDIKRRKKNMSRKY